MEIETVQQVPETSEIKKVPIVQIPDLPELLSSIPEIILKETRSKPIFKKPDIRPLNEALNAVENFTIPVENFPELKKRSQKVRKVNHRKMMVNGPLLGQS